MKNRQVTDWSAQALSLQSERLAKSGQIGVRIGRVVNKYKVAKHFALTIENKHFDFQIHQDQVATDATLDGVYVLRTRVPKKQLSAAGTVRSYKALCGVERAFRSLKTVDLKIRPIHHWLEPRVRAHIFLYMLAYYVEWHMREAWRELLFAATRILRPSASAIRSRPLNAQNRLCRKSLGARSTIASPCTVSRRCCSNSPPSCAIPAAREIAVRLTSWPSKMCASASTRSSRGRRCSAIIAAPSS